MTKFKIWLGATALSVAGLVAAPALAADLPEPIPEAPIVEVAPAAFDWTGFYIGANIGYGFGGDDVVGVFSDGSFVGDAGDLEASGILGGLQAGYNYQYGNFVIGLEGDIQLSDIGDDVSGNGVDVESTVSWYGTVRPRIGYAFDRLLVYGTGGVAFGDYEYEGDIEGSETFVGWTAGAGLEYAFTDNLTAKFEYQYVNLGDDTFEDAGLSTKATPDFHAVKLGVNYKF